MKLVLAEKPSVAMSLSKVIGADPVSYTHLDVYKRQEYSTMLRRQLAQGNNGLTKTKYLTFGIEAESMKQDVYKRQ